jgi:alpha-L-fucosidase 2
MDHQTISEYKINRWVNNFMKKCLLLALLFCQHSFSQPADSLLKLWYDKPAGHEWEAAMPLGNGRLAAMLFGNTDSERLQLNESTVWSGGPNRNDNPHSLAALPEIRRLIFAGKNAEAARLAAADIQSERINGMTFQPVGYLDLNFRGQGQVENYYRELNLETATATIKYTVQGIHYTRKVFISLPDQVIVIRLTADRPHSLNFNAGFSSPQHSSSHTRGNNEVILTGITSDHDGVQGSVKFQSVLKLKTVAGSISVSGNKIEVSHADTVTLYISIATNFINYHNLGQDEKKRADDYIKGIENKNYQRLYSDHVAAYQYYFRRVKLDLGTTEAANNPTNKRLNEYADGRDPQLAALYFQYGRYLLISSSEPGGQPANLQGIWNDKMNPPWGSKYTININTEMNYWPAEETNLEEMAEPLIQMLKDLAVTGRETARVMYGARGWVAHHNTDLWRITGPVDGIYSAMWPMGGAWLCRQLWEKYLYSGDRKYLGSVYAVLREAAVFYLDFLVEEPTHHWLVVCPSMSPENNPSAMPGVSIAAGVTMDNQILFELFTNVIRSAEILDTDKNLIMHLRTARDRLPPMQIGKYGQLQEWMQDLDDSADRHRHVSHLFGLYPSNQISPFRNPDLFEAAMHSLIFRGDVSTGWSMGWKVNLWARLLDGNHAYKLITDQLTPAGRNSSGGGTYPNLLDAHPPFQIDGNFGCTAGITEMILQSQDAAIFLLPALPDMWSNGTVRWKNGHLLGLRIRSNLGGICRIRSYDRLMMKSRELPIAVGKNKNPFYYLEVTKNPWITDPARLHPQNFKTSYLYDISTQPGNEYEFTLKQGE